MRKPIEIGDKSFKLKKDALAHYKNILNAYSFDESLNDDDFYDVFDLLLYNADSWGEENPDNIQPEQLELFEEEVTITDVKIAQVQYGTKCFEVIYSNGESWCISYIMMINRHKQNPKTTFMIACRSAIQKDLRSVKKAFFDKNSVKGKAKCQETGVDSSWTELVVDHRQPNTLSVIVDRFVEVSGIDVASVGYSTGEDNMLILDDILLTEKFREYHKAKATLRIVRKECNSSRSNLARVNIQKKDLRIE